MTAARQTRPRPLELMDYAAPLLPGIRERARQHDEDGTFVHESAEALQRAGLYAAMVPTELGGLGGSFADTCDLIRELAHHCPSTSLAFSMHTHLVAVAVAKYERGLGGETLLRKVADGSALVSTGGGDWLESNGTLERVGGGYRLTGRKHFASGSPFADLMVTSARYEDPERGTRVLHFPVCFDAEGVRLAGDWDAHGMRGTGSQTVILEGVFVPEGSIGLDRPAGEWHPAFAMVSTFAMPIFMSAYVGVAERAVELALESAERRREDRDVQALAGELLNELFLVRSLWRSHVANGAEGEPDTARAARSLQAKTLLADACVRTVDKAMELAGGSAFFRRSPIEQLRRDVRAAAFHPLQRARQHRFSGRLALGLSPV